MLSNTTFSIGVIGAGVLENSRWLFLVDRTVEYNTRYRGRNALNHTTICADDSYDSSKAEF